VDLFRRSLSLQTRDYEAHVGTSRLGKKILLGYQLVKKTWVMSHVYDTHAYSVTACFLMYTPSSRGSSSSHSVLLKVSRLDILRNRLPLTVPN